MTTKKPAAHSVDEAHIIGCNCQDCRAGRGQKPAAKTAHTPGPWRLDNDGSILATDWEGDGKPGIARIVCDVRDSEKWGMGHERAVANARLIAAAPDLLAALKTTERLLTNLYEGGNVMIDKAIDGARAAIAKAEAEGR